MRIRAALLLIVWAPIAPAAEDGALRLVRLENANFVVEVAPRLGGRIATLRRPDGENVFSFAAANRAMPESALPVAAADGAYFPCHGHVVWIGPQQDWWTQQEVNPARRAQRATWPPDPWLEYGSMEVVERTADAVRLTGSPSPISGLRLELRIRLAADGTVVEEIEAVNRSERTVSWDIWPNTRVRPDAQVFAPYDTGSRLRVEYGTSDPVAERPLPPVMRDGFLTFDTRRAPGEEDTLRVGKAFLKPSEPVLYAAAPRDLLIVAARSVAPGGVHPAHAPVEVYQCVGGDPARAVLELEFHSALTALPPGAGLRFAVGWRVLPMSGEPLAAIRGSGDAVRRLRTAVERTD